MNYQPAAKRQCTVPQHPLTLRGINLNAGKQASGDQFHRICQAVVSFVHIVAVDVSRQSAEKPESRWHLSGWIDATTPVVVVIVSGLRAAIGLVGNEIVSMEMPNVKIPLPGGGFKRVSAGKRMVGGVDEVFVDATFDTLSLQQCESLSEAQEYIAEIDRKQYRLGSRVTLAPSFLKFLEFDLSKRVWVSRRETGLLSALIGFRELPLDTILANAPDVQRVLSLIRASSLRARHLLTPAMICRVAASLTIHCRDGMDPFTLRDMLGKLLLILGVSAFKLREMMTRFEPHPVEFWPELAERLRINPLDSTDWPYHPGSMVICTLPWEEAIRLGFSLKFMQVTSHAILHRGTMYFGPGALSIAEVTSFGNRALVDRLENEIRGAADRLQDDDWTRTYFEQMAVRFNFGVIDRQQKAIDQLNLILANVGPDTLKHEQRRSVAKTLVRCMSVDERARYRRRIENVMKDHPERERRLFELDNWIKWWQQKYRV